MFKIWFEHQTFNNWTHFNNWDTELVRYSDPHCIFIFIGNKLKVKVTFCHCLKIQICSQLPDGPDHLQIQREPRGNSPRNPIRRESNENSGESHSF